MTTYDDNNYMIAWDGLNAEPRVKVGPHPDRLGWSDDYSSTSGCCYGDFHDLPEPEQAQALLNLAAEIMFDGVSPQDVLREFAKIRVWREMGVLMPFGKVPRAFLCGSVDWNPHFP